MTASKTLPSPSESRHLWLTFASGVIAAAFVALYFWFARDFNPLWLAEQPKALIGVVFVAFALAQLRPREGIYRGIAEHLLWGGSLAHFFIFFMCASALVFIEDPREVGPVTALALYAVFYSLLVWIIALTYALLDPSPASGARWSIIRTGVTLFTISPLIYIPALFAMLAGSMTSNWRAEVAAIPENFVLIDAEPFLFTAAASSIITGLITVAAKPKITTHFLTQVAGLFVLIHALLTFTKVISFLFMSADPGALTPSMSATISGYAFIAIAYLIGTALTKRRLTRLPHRGALLTAAFSALGAYFVFTTVAPAEVLMSALVPLVLLVSVLTYLSNLEVNIAERTSELEDEKRKTEDLLGNILPQHVVRELKDKGASSPRLFDDVSVMFTDFVGFTEIAQRLTPEQLISQLNEIFTGFDAIVERHHSERIKTIGDAYMCVSGLTGSDSMPTKNLITVASEMLDFAAQFNEDSNTSWQIRIGIASGSCIAGIVGTKKYQFDLFGDTVNTAARMEAYSSPGLINVDERSFELTKNDTGLVFDARPLTHVKGKGDQKMFFVASAP
jgi:class 3 adenylate cyclase